MSRSRADTLLAFGVRFIAAGAAVLVGAIALFLIIDAWPALGALGSRLIGDNSWHPSPRADAGTFGMAPMIWGTLVCTLGASLLATPLGVASAVFSRFYAPPRLSRWYRRAIGLLAGIPSVVYGFWGLTVLAPAIARFHPPGPSALAGILILTVMILPTIALLTDAALGAVPADYIRGAAALGMRRSTVIRGVALPAARGGVQTAVILGTARAVGETMAVLMVCGNIVAMPDSVFDPVRTLTANIALEMGYALGDHRSALFASGLVLIVMVALLISATELCARAPERAGGAHR